MAFRFFEAFIKERSMYYVCSNIVKPLTEPFQLSFAEVVGPTAMQWFVSHYWGMAVRHFNDAIRDPTFADQSLLVLLLFLGSDLGAPEIT